MCSRGDTVPMVLPKRPLSDQFGRHLPYAIDRCIAPLVAALNRSGLTTVASCCGHGEVPGNIALGDGRWLVIAENQAAFDHLMAADDGADPECPFCLTDRAGGADLEPSHPQPNGREQVR